MSACEELRDSPAFSFIGFQSRVDFSGCPSLTYSLTQSSIGCPKAEFKYHLPAGKRSMSDETNISDTSCDATFVAALSKPLTNTI